ncbi:unnamed protein product [Symbiodinium pilosum]|uniref:Uncharacterized protein n=1 Tax=Symbiodinium pilosum TaxID=2952 RepID=A0A812TBG0_SYMPI|nr:unnamed protein product [Symbiodinium pilosum]
MLLGVFGWPREVPVNELCLYEDPAGSLEALEGPETVEGELSKREAGAGLEQAGIMHMEIEASEQSEKQWVHVSSHLKLDIWKFLPAVEICKSRAVSRTFATAKEIVDHLKAVVDLSRKDALLAEAVSHHQQAADMGMQWFGEEAEDPLLNFRLDAAMLERRDSFRCLVNLGNVWFAHAPFSMLDLVWRLAFHTEDHPGDDLLYDAVYFSTRSSAVTSLNRLLLMTPAFHHWLAQQRVANS